jgi:hypothetical protein
MGKTFQAAQLAHEIFDHISLLQNMFLISAKLNFQCVVLYVMYSPTHQTLVEVQFGRYQKNILQEWSMIKNLACVSCAAWNVFPINSLMPFSSCWCMISCDEIQFIKVWKIKKSFICFIFLIQFSFSKATKYFDIPAPLWYKTAWKK